MADIWAYIAEGSPANATAFLEELQSHFEPMLIHPDIGVARPDLAENLRACFFRRYAIYYLPTDTEIIIVRVVHGSRDRKALFHQETEH